jgi:hypothetical protein
VENKNSVGEYGLNGFWKKAIDAMSPLGLRGSAGAFISTGLMRVVPDLPNSPTDEYLYYCFSSAAVICVLVMIFGIVINPSSKG